MRNPLVLTVLYAEFLEVSRCLEESFWGTPEFENLEAKVTKAHTPEEIAEKHILRKYPVRRFNTSLRILKYRIIEVSITTITSVRRYYQFDNYGRVKKTSRPSDYVLNVKPITDPKA